VESIKGEHVMGLNKAKGNMYEFVTHTWNVVKGECPHGCSYCYMKRRGKQSPLHLDEKELKTDLGSDNVIFVGSSCDMFADYIPWSWTERIIEYARTFDNEYLFQTKNPDRFTFINGLSVEKDILCTTIETDFYPPEITNDAPFPYFRAIGMKNMKERGFRTWVTIEPVMDFDLGNLLHILKWLGPERVNIGADSGNNHLPEPPKEKTGELIAELKKFTMVAQKKNMGRLLT
jgi:DNA repair photolyase